jgi:hypothetical protein
VCSHRRTLKDEGLVYQLISIMSKTCDLLEKHANPAASIHDDTFEYTQINRWMQPILNELRVRHPSIRLAEITKEIRQSDDRSLFKFLEEQNLQSAYESFPSSVSSYDEIMSLGAANNRLDQTNNSSFRYSPAEFTTVCVRLLQHLHPVLKLSTSNARFLNVFSSKLAAQLRAVGRDLEKSYYVNKYEDTIMMTHTTTVESARNVRSLLKTGELLISLVLANWNIDSSVVGAANPFTYRVDTSNGPMEATEQIISRHYLKPVQLFGDGLEDVNSVLDAVPVAVRSELQSLIAVMTSPKSSLNINSRDDAKALLVPYLFSHAVRVGVGAQFRSLVTYYSNKDDWPKQRDGVFLQLMTDIICGYLSASSVNTHTDNTCVLSRKERPFVSALIVMAALEEAMAIKEPRKQCGLAYQLALMRLGLQHLQAVNQTDVLPSKLYVQRVETALQLISKLFASNIEEFKLKALNRIVIHTLSQYTSAAIEFDDDDENGASRYSRALSTGKMPSLIESIQSLQTLAETVFNVSHVAATNLIQNCLAASCEQLLSKLLTMSLRQDSDPELADFYRVQHEKIAHHAQNILGAMDGADKQIIVHQQYVLLIAASIESLLDAARVKYLNNQLQSADAIISKLASFCTPENMKRLLTAVIVPIDERSRSAEEPASVLLSQLNRALVKIISAKLTDKTSKTQMFHFMDAIVHRYKFAGMRVYCTSSSERALLILRLVHRRSEYEKLCRISE